MRGLEGPFSLGHKLRREKCRLSPFFCSEDSAKLVPTRTDHRFPVSRSGVPGAPVTVEGVLV